MAVHFRQRKTLLRLPFSRVLGSFGSVGDIDVSTSSEAQYPRVIAALLEGMRTEMLGSEDGVVAGTFALPAARVRQNKRNPT